MINTKSEGFIALLPSLIISALLVSIVFAENETMFMSKMNQIETDYKIISKHLAESCMNIAQLRIIAQENYEGSEDISIEDKLCKIGPVEYFDNGSGTNTISVKTSAKYNSSYTNLREVFSFSTLNGKNEMTLTSKTEIP